MHLSVRNFAKISKAELDFDGLTVIAGENNTGKSTTGKILYSIFRSLSRMDKRVENERIRAVQNAINRIPRIQIESDVAKGVLYDSVKLSELVQPDTNEFFIKNAQEAIDRAKVTDYNKIAANLVHRVFDCVFHHQYLPLQPYDGESRLELTVQKVTNTIRFFDGAIQAVNPIPLVKVVRLIATPDVLSLVNVRDISTNESYGKAFEKYTLELAQELVKDSKLSVVEELAAQGELSEINTILDEFISGEFGKDDENEYSLFEHNHSKPTKAENLSMGLKFFVLLRFMLTRGVLSDRDVLILDEPENHLHPSMQVVYAQVLVLLQKKFHLTILVTSHSQFFVNALQRFSLSEGISKKTRFYMTREDEEQKGFYTFDDKAAFATDIFRSFNRAYNALGVRSREFAESGVD